MNTYIFFLVRYWAYGFDLSKVKGGRSLMHERIEIQAPNKDNAKAQVRISHPDWAIRFIQSKNDLSIAIPETALCHASA